MVRPTREDRFEFLVEFFEPGRFSVVVEVELKHHRQLAIGELDEPRVSSHFIGDGAVVFDVSVLWTAFSFNSEVFEHCNDLEH